jgi:hypothetical protein
MNEQQVTRIAIAGGRTALVHAAIMSRLSEYQVVGRKLPTEKEPVPKIYRMRLFAPNTVWLLLYKALLLPMY